VRTLALILSIVLSFLSGGHRAEVTVSPVPSENTVDYSPARDICITAAQGYTFAGNNCTNTVSGRTTPSPRRTNPQVRSTFRIVKSGKVIDNNHLHPFLARPVVHLAGIYLSERYLFSICRLRL